MTTLAPEAAPVKARRDTRALYRPLDIHSARTEVWPDLIPALTEAEAIKATRILCRRFLYRRRYEEAGRPVPRKLTTLPVTINTRLSYPRFRYRGIEVNHHRGWRNLVHSLSHRFHRRLRPGDRPHSDSHRHLEKEMISFVVSKGWLDGALRR